MKKAAILFLCTALSPLYAHAGLVTIRESADRVYVEYTGESSGKTEASREVVRPQTEARPGEEARTVEVDVPSSAVQGDDSKEQTAEPTLAQKEETHWQEMQDQARRQEAEGANLPDEARRAANEARAEERRQERESRARMVRRSPRRGATTGFNEE